MQQDVSVLNGNATSLQSTFLAAAWNIVFLIPASWAQEPFPTYEPCDTGSGVGDGSSGVGDGGLSVGDGGSRVENDGSGVDGNGAGLGDRNGKSCTRIAI